ncbi:ARM repeat-containing protein [Myriangium duriaei CBS 260.36]|uniref:ARM repeat-containing protein n=1 Tax=Myriangium duriaei CBS 260.36 TaxID=1168546 RepID=A0A9P4MH89_9PEZI|nr:ARM repeat-containing protein [Myriangium duriaei CBS 260.36]
MAGLKRSAETKTTASQTSKKQKTSATAKSGSKSSKQQSKPTDEITAQFPSESASDFSDDEANNQLSSGRPRAQPNGYNGSSKQPRDHNGDDKKFKLATSSAEAHAAQRALAKERKAAKPNADIISRSKKIWERLRRKSHVPLEERKELVAELYAIINGRVRDFVFKHDSVRVIQCALKYANKEQRLNITRELQTDMRALVESKYGKFMVAKIVVEGDQEIRNLVIPEFYGHIKRLINHPEAAWIVDDIYRQVATSEQKARMLIEWYGPEFALDNKIKDDTLKKSEKPTADLAALLEKHPEKRKPVMQHLHQLVNQLIQKKMTGFTMLHDAMYQYFVNVPVGSEEAGEFLENLKGDLDDPSGGGDLLKNLAFTQNGSKVVCLALAYGSAKDRKLILRVYKEVMEMMAFDAHAYQVLLAALEVTDDTKMSAKAIYSELLFENISDENERDDRLIAILTNRTARVPLLYPLAGDAKWLMPAGLTPLLTEVHEIRNTTSKKLPIVRSAELTSYLAPALLALINRQPLALATNPLGSQAVTEIFLATSPIADPTTLEAAVSALTATAAGDPIDSSHPAHNPGAGRMFRALVAGGRFDPVTKTVTKPARPLGFANALFDVVQEQLAAWAVGPSSFVVVAMVETDELDGKKREKVLKVLRKEKKKLEKAAKGEKGEKGNAGAKLLLEKI